MTKIVVKSVERLFKFLIIPVILVVLVAMLCGCATVHREEDREALLKTTAERYWKLRLEDKYDDTYKMEDRQGLPPFEEYRDRAMAVKRITITSISVKSANVSGDKGVVDLEWSYVLPRIAQPFHQVIRDEWALRDGKWRHIFPP